MTIHYVSDKQILVGKIGEVDLSLLNLTPASYVLDVGCGLARLSKNWEIIFFRKVTIFIAPKYKYAYRLG